MSRLSEIIVEQLLKEASYPNRYALSVKIAGKDISSASLTKEEKEEVNKILRMKGIPIILK